MEGTNTIYDIKLTIQSGGIIKFEKTGILPSFLVFHSKRLGRTWRLKLKEDNQNGVLKINGQVAYHYFFGGLGCTLKIIDCGVVISTWEIAEILMELRD